jgi:hypothetical protein
MKDFIGSADMTQGSLSSFTTDRFGNVKSALALNGGWTQVQAGVYFDSIEFTISVWVYPMNVGSWARIIDFGNGQSADNIVLSLSYSNSLKPDFVILSGSNLIFQTISTKPITLNQWQFLTSTINGTNARIYLNGTLVANIQNYNLPIHVSRSKCYIGKSNWPDGYSSSHLDDLRFYYKSLTQEEIIELMNFHHNETSEFSITFVCFLNEINSVFKFIKKKDSYLFGTTTTTTTANYLTIPSVIQTSSENRPISTLILTFNRNNFAGVL